MKHRNLKVSIIMNCFNGEEYLQEAVDSVLNQTYQNWELIFWDNRSSDNSEKNFKKNKDKKLKYFKAKKHTLLYEARDQAIKQSTGDIIAFLDVDDLWHPRKLELQLPLFEDELVGFSCTNYWILDENSGRKKIFTKRKIVSGWVLNDLLANYQIGLLTLLIRRNAYLDLTETFDKNFQIIGDFDITVRLSRHWKLASLQQPLANYRKHAGNLGRSNKDLQVIEYGQWFTKMKRYPDVLSQPAYGRVLTEVRYMKALLYLNTNKIYHAHQIMFKTPWCAFKVKFYLQLIAKAYSLTKQKFDLKL